MSYYCDEANHKRVEQLLNDILHTDENHRETFSSSPESVSSSMQESHEIKTRLKTRPREDLETLLLLQHQDQDQHHPHQRKRRNATDESFTTSWSSCILQPSSFSPPIITLTDVFISTRRLSLSLIEPSSSYSSFPLRHHISSSFSTTSSDDNTNCNAVIITDRRNLFPPPLNARGRASLNGRWWSRKNLGYSFFRPSPCIRSSSFSSNQRRNAVTIPPSTQPFPQHFRTHHRTRSSPLPSFSSSLESDPDSSSSSSSEEEEEQQQRQKQNLPISLPTPDPTSLPIGFCHNFPRFQSQVDEYHESFVPFSLHLGDSLKPQQSIITSTTTLWMRRNATTFSSSPGSGSMDIRGVMAAALSRRTHTGNSLACS